MPFPNYPSPSTSYLNFSLLPRSAMTNASMHETHDSNGDDPSASFLLTHPPLGAASAAASADPLSLPDLSDLNTAAAAAATTDKSAQINHSSSSSPTGGRSGSGGSGSSGNEASISNTSGDPEIGGSGAKSKQTSSQPADPTAGSAPVGAGSSSAAGPTKLSDRDPHSAYHHRGQHQFPARPALIAGAAVSATDGSSDDAAEGTSSHLFARPPPLQLRKAVNASATCWSPPKPHAPPVGRAMPTDEHDERDEEDQLLPFPAPAHPSNSTLPTVSSSVQAISRADTAAGHPCHHQPLGAIASSSTIATTTAGSSGRGSSSRSRTKPSGKPKPFVCDQCGIGFSRFQNLKSHMLTHQNVRPFPCEECGQAFSRLHDLKRHQRLHTGARPFTCSNCFRSFARLDALNRHRESNSCQNVNLPQSLRDVALAHAAMTGMPPASLPGPAATAPTIAPPDAREDVPVAAAVAVTGRKRGRPTRAQAAAALTVSAANQHAGDNAHTAPAAAPNNASSSPPGAANGNRASTDSRPATSASNSVVPSDSVSQQHARRGGAPGASGAQRSKQSSDSSDGPRPPALPLQHPGGATGAPGGSASRDGSPLDLYAHPYDAAAAGVAAMPARTMINGATESWRVQQRQYGGPPAMGPGPALHMWGSPPLYASRGAAAAAAASVSPIGAALQHQQHQVDLASPLFLGSVGVLEAGRKRRRGTSTSPVVGGTPPGSQLDAGKHRSRIESGEHGPELDADMLGDPGPAPDSGPWERGGGLDLGPAPPPAAAGGYHRSTASHQRQQQYGPARGTPPQPGAVGMSLSSGANQSGSNSSAYIKGSTTTGGPLPAPNSTSVHAHPYQVHQAQSVDATVAAGGGDSSADGTPQPPPHQQHHHAPQQQQQQQQQQHHAGLEVMHRRLDMLMQDNLWLRSRIVDLEHQSQADRMRMMEQDDQIRALLVERNVRRGGSHEDPLGAAADGGASVSVGSAGHLPINPHGRSSSFLPPQAHGRYYELGPYGHSPPPPQYYAEDAYGYLPPMVPGSSGGPWWNPAAPAARGYSDLVDDLYRHGQPPGPPPPPLAPASTRHASRHYYQHPAYAPNQEHSQYDPRDAAGAMQQGQQLQLYPRYDDVGMDDELNYAAALHVPKRRRVVSPAGGNNAGGGPNNR